MCRVQRGAIFGAQHRQGAVDAIDRTVGANRDPIVATQARRRGKVERREAGRIHHLRSGQAGGAGQPGTTRRGEADTGHARIGGGIEIRIRHAAAGVVTDNAALAVGA